MIHIAGLHVRYQSDRGEVHAVRGINLQIKEGQFYTLLGPSGCGKTSTLRCLAGLEAASEGEITIAGTLSIPHRVAFWCLRISAISAWFSNPMPYGRT